jgi:hypothetical protein
MYQNIDNINMLLDSMSSAQNMLNGMFKPYQVAIFLSVILVSLCLFKGLKTYFRVLLGFALVLCFIGYTAKYNDLARDLYNIETTLIVEYDYELDI